MEWMVAVDLENDPGEVLTRAVPLAARLGATLHLRTVSRFAWDATDVFGAGSEALAQEWERRRKAEVARLGELRGSIPEPMQGTAELLEGRTAAALVAEASQFDGVIIGTHGRTGVQRLFLGSVAERVVRTCSVPVWVLHLQGRPLAPDGPLKVLAPVDPNDLDLQPLQRASEWLGEAATLQVASVLRSLGPMQMADVGVPSRTWTLDDHPQRLWAERRVTEALADAGVSARCHWLYEEGRHPAALLAELAESLEADVLVLATHGRRNLQRLAYGSVAERLVRYVSCATLVVR
ncbi:MAG: universal stress protein [Myxococcales bacterium]|nr:universal stress protein [Myxococcales bacterium]